MYFGDLGIKDGVRDLIGTADVGDGELAEKSQNGSGRGAPSCPERQIRHTAAPPSGAHSRIPVWGTQPHPRLGHTAAPPSGAHSRTPVWGTQPHPRLGHKKRKERSTKLGLTSRAGPKRSPKALRLHRRCEEFRAAWLCFPKHKRSPNLNTAKSKHTKPAQPSF